ncbi:YdcF family protein [Anoxynatronum sibiricum]|uniref:YdcF family protein n=1 Tax=Anoxynatronum sibiricum TaxID=210623 RepID=A0ABU9VRL8_9CLOT
MIITGLSCFILTLVTSVRANGLTFLGYGLILAGLGCFSIAFARYLGDESKKKCQNTYPWPYKIRNWLAAMCMLLISTFLVTQGLLLAVSTSKDVPADAIALVPGAGIIRKEPSFTLAGRLDTAALFLKDRPNSTVVLTGGHSDGQLASEAQVMAWYLERHGIDAERMILEEKASNTMENITYAVEMMNMQENHSGNAVLIITSDYHLLRSMMLARRYGLQVYGMEAHSPAALYRQYAIREFFAIFKSMLFDWPVSRQKTTG